MDGMKFVLIALTVVLIAQPALVAASPGTSTLQPLGIALETYRYPYPVHFLPLQLQGEDVRMAYMDAPAAHRANGRTMVLLHGKNFGGYYFGALMGELCAAGYRVIAPDQIGWGKSSKPDIRYSFQLLAANTAHLLDTLHVTKAVVLGHSTGGMLAVRFALMYPERVSQLILEDPIGLEDYRALAPAQSDRTLYEAELRKTDAKAIRAFYAHYFAAPRPEFYEPLADVQIRVTLSGEYPRWAKASALAYQMIYQQPVRYEYRLLKPPTLIVVGQQDHTAPFSTYAPPEIRGRMGHVPELARAAASEIPHGAVVVIPDCGHIPHIERSAEFKKAIVNFLNR